MYNQDKIWELYQNDESLQDMGCRDGGRIGFIAKCVPKNGAILNIGVGKGTLEIQLHNSGRDVYSLDPSETSIKKLQAKLSMGDRARSGYSQNIPFEDNLFNCVVMTEVLEHLSDEVLRQTLSEVTRVLKNDGEFIGSVPADENLAGSKVACPHCGELFHRWGHQQSFSVLSLSDCLKKNFQTVRVKRVVFADWRNLNWKGKLSTSLRKIQSSLNAKGSNQNLFFRVKNQAQ